MGMGRVKDVFYLKARDKGFAPVSWKFRPVWTDFAEGVARKKKKNLLHDCEFPENRGSPSARGVKKFLFLLPTFVVRIC